MHRRGFLRAAAVGGLAAATGLAAPRLSLSAESKVLRFVPQANLANLDPIWTTQYVVRNGSLLIWDTLYGVNDKLEPQAADGRGSRGQRRLQDLDLQAALRPEIPRQRAGAGRRTSSPASTAGWCAIRRWACRSRTGSTRWRRWTTAPSASASSSPTRRCCSRWARAARPVLFIMPERIAATDPFKQISDYVGSGPMRFKKDEWVPGSGAVFERFDGYVPRAEKARLAVRRQADAISTASSGRSCRTPRPPPAALQNGEVDWLETPLPDLVPLLQESARRRRSISPIRWAISAPSASTICIRRSTTCGRAARCRSRSARKTTCGAVVGDDRRRCGRRCPASSRPDTPLYTEQGGDYLKGQRKYDDGEEAARRGRLQGRADHPAGGDRRRRSPRRRATSPPTC